MSCGIRTINKEARLEYLKNIESYLTRELNMTKRLIKRLERENHE